MDKPKLFSTLTFIVISSLFNHLLCEQINIDITSYDPNDVSTQIFHEFVEESAGESLEIVIHSNSTNASGFYVLQVHSFLYSVSLWYNDSQKNVTGKNVGIVRQFKGQFETSFQVDKHTEGNVTLLVAVAIYDTEAPLPGGCSASNKTPLTDIFPTIQVINKRDTIGIEADSPQTQGGSCGNDSQIEIYHKFLPSQNFDQFVYFQGILDMLPVAGAKLNGRLVANISSSELIQRNFSTYLGVGEVFAVVVSSNGKNSAYIPTISYGEEVEILIKKEEDGTKGRDLFVTLFSMLPFVAVLIIFWGHTFFHFTTFSLGLSCGTIVSFFLLSKQGASTVDDQFLISLLIGVLYGIVWVTIWYKCGVPLLSASLAFFHLGALIASIVYHTGIADGTNFHNDGLYWSLFFAIVITCWFFFSVFTMHGHIFSCAFLGSYILMITTMNYWMGGNLQYIIINVYRRALVPHFNTAILDPPFQPRDVFVVSLGLFLVMLGYKKQIKNQRGKPPFPPYNSHRFYDENSPLLGSIF